MFAGIFIKEKMKREINKRLITEDKLMCASDMAKVGCQSCEGCGECCKGRGSSVTLDSWDVGILKKAFDMTFQQLINSGMISLEPVNDVVLPILGKKEGVDECFFIGIDGRCTIHKIRPGICRLFPLARIYHKDGSFSYFLQEGECPYLDGSEEKISDWIGLKNIEGYERQVREYHDRLVVLRKACAETDDEDELVRLKRQFLIDNFVKFTV